MRTKPFLAVVGAVLGAVAVLAYRNSPHDVVVDTWEDVSLSNFMSGELEGDWWGGDERATVFLHIEKRRSRAALAIRQDVQAFWVELGEVGLGGPELRLLTPGMPPVRCAVEVDLEGGATIVAMSDPTGWPRLPLRLERPGEDDALPLRDAVRRSLEPGCREIVWREVAPETYERGLMGPDLAFAAFAEDGIAREPAREEAALRATIWTIEDQRASRSPFR